MKFLVFNFLIISVIYLHKADIPTHCTKKQVVGEWEFKASKPMKKSGSELYKLTCGHNLPSHESTAYRIDQQLVNTFTENFKVEFSANDEAVYKQDDNTPADLKGKWTMVYDEGFDFSFNERGSKDYKSFFVFQKYALNDGKNPEVKSKWASYCYTTLIGWYHLDDSWGCLIGTKVGKSDSEVTNGEAAKKQVVTEGSMVEKTFLEKSMYIKSPKNGYISSYQNELPLENRFMESKFSTRLELNSNFKDHSLVVERINSMDYTWKAANYDEFEGMTIFQLNKIAGRKKAKNNFFNFHENGAISLNDLFKKERENAINIVKKDKSSSSLKRLKNGYPESFNYLDYMGEPKSQGSCGSCFAVSTITMIEARLRKNYPQLVQKYFGDPKKLLISLEHVLKCSVYNQGCDGGYSYLVGKFFNEYEMLPKECFRSSKDKCGENICTNQPIAKLKMSVSDFYYTGGSYGATNEQNLMEEVFKNGPMVVSMEPEYSFMMYRSGIYDVNAANWLNSNLSKPEWQKVDHSVVLVGWGVDKVKGKDVKYWLLQNSWGKNWGEAGYMKFKRGVDLLGIESIGEAAVPTMKEI